MTATDPRPALASTSGVTQVDAATATATAATGPSRWQALTDWLCTPVPAGRVAAFRTLVYLYIPFELLWAYPWVLQHKDLPGTFYRPLLVGRLLPLPVPTEQLVTSVHWALIAAALAAATGRAPRLLGWVVGGLYLEWQFIAMSYGKVDHDRFGLIVTLLALATVGPTRWGDTTPTERGGWALRVAQLGAIATYFLAAFAKLRFGGPEWLWGATLARAVIRRGTFFSEWMLDVPGLLVAMQVFIVVFELGAPVVFFVGERARRRIVALLYAFHVGTFASIRIAFWPHLANMAAFLPLEKVRPIVTARRLAGRLAIGLSRSRSSEPAGRRALPGAGSTPPSHPAGGDGSG
jgi:hypothetical protein